MFEACVKCVQETDVDGEYAVLRDLLSQVGVIVALHPDEVTEAVIDFAVEKEIPFAIVPCCVFYRLFPQRRCPRTLSPVREYAQLLDYLQAKHPMICRDYLDFAGTRAHSKHKRREKRSAATDARVPNQVLESLVDHNQRNVVLYCTSFVV